MAIFIMGTDTDVGKTFITALVAKSLKDRGIQVGIQKWVSTGDGSASQDLEFIKKFASLSQDITPGTRACPYCFSLPASPHLAAQMQGVRIEPERLVFDTRSLERQFQILLIEGVGGGLVPLNKDLLLIDLVAKLGLPVLVVARAELGTLNHTLLTLEALRTRNIEVLGVIFNRTGICEEVIIEDNLKTISQMGKTKVFGPVPRVSSPELALDSIEMVADLLSMRVSP